MNLAIIAGGSKGIGLALDQQYLREGWQVKELSRSGQSHHSLFCDFSDRQQSIHILEDLFKALAQEDWKKVHLIYNAGRLGQITPLTSIEPEDALLTVDVNFTSLVLCTQLFARYFQEHSAHKVLAAITSGAANKDFIGWSLYCSTKAAMDRFITCFALEQQSLNSPIYSVLISPGVVDTQMQSQIRDSSIEDFPQVEYFQQLKNDNALASPEHIAGKIYTVMNSHPENGRLYRVADY